MKTITNILNQYNIPEVTPIKLIRESGDNHVYLIGEKHKKILRVSKRLPIEDVRFEYEALQHLARKSVPVPGWVTTKDGKLYSSVDGVDVTIMFEFLEGYHVVLNKDNLPNTEQAYTAGRMLGAIAEAGTTFKPTFTRRRNIFVELERVLHHEEIFKRDFEGGGLFVEQVKEVLVFGHESKSPLGLIHNDYRSGNVFFKNDREISGIIDFDWSCVGQTVKDLALGVLEWSCPDGWTEPDFVLFDAFLEGYNSMSTKKYSRNKELYSWIMFAALSDTATFFCDRLNSPELKKKITYSYMYKKYEYFSKL